jgi:hypothetical protein
MTTDLSDRKSRALGQEPHNDPAQRDHCSVCRLDRARRSRASRIHKAARDRRLLHMALEALR